MLSIKSHIQGYFLNLVTGPDVSMILAVCNSFQDRLKHHDCLSLFSPVSYKEVKLALFSMNGFKSPDLDGFHLVFLIKNAGIMCTLFLFVNFLWICLPLV